MAADTQFPLVENVSAPLLSIRATTVLPGLTHSLEIICLHSRSMRSAAVQHYAFEHPSSMRALQRVTHPKGSHFHEETEAATLCHVREVQNAKLLELLSSQRNKNEGTLMDSYRDKTSV